MDDILQFAKTGEWTAFYEAIEKKKREEESSKKEISVAPLPSTAVSKGLQHRKRKQLIPSNVIRYGELTKTARSRWILKEEIKIENKEIDESQTTKTTKPQPEDCERTPTPPIEKSSIETTSSLWRSLKYCIGRTAKSLSGASHNTAPSESESPLHINMKFQLGGSMYSTTQTNNNNNNNNSGVEALLNQSSSNQTLTKGIRNNLSSRSRIPNWLSSFTSIGLVSRERVACNGKHPYPPGLIGSIRNCCMFAGIHDLLIRVDSEITALAQIGYWGDPMGQSHRLVIVFDEEQDCRLSLSVTESASRSIITEERKLFNRKSLSFGCVFYSEFTHKYQQLFLQEKLCRDSILSVSGIYMNEVVRISDAVCYYYCVLSLVRTTPFDAVDGLAAAFMWTSYEEVLQPLSTSFHILNNPKKYPPIRIEHAKYLLSQTSSFVIHLNRMLAALPYCREQCYRYMRRRESNCISFDTNNLIFGYPAMGTTSRNVIENIVVDHGVVLMFADKCFKKISYASADPSAGQCVLYSTNKIYSVTSQLSPECCRLFGGTHQILYLSPANDHSDDFIKPNRILFHQDIALKPIISNINKPVVYLPYSRSSLSLSDSIRRWREKSSTNVVIVMEPTSSSSFMMPHQVVNELLGSGICCQFVPLSSCSSLTKGTFRESNITSAVSVISLLDLDAATIRTVGSTASNHIRKCRENNRLKTEINISNGILRCVIQKWITLLELYVKDSLLLCEFSCRNYIAGNSVEEYDYLLNAFYARNHVNHFDQLERIELWRREAIINQHQSFTDSMNIRSTWPVVNFHVGDVINPGVVIPRKVSPLADLSTSERLSRTSIVVDGLSEWLKLASTLVPVYSAYALLSLEYSLCNPEDDYKLHIRDKRDYIETSPSSLIAFWSCGLVRTTGVFVLVPKTLLNHCDVVDIVGDHYSTWITTDECRSKIDRLQDSNWTEYEAYFEKHVTEHVDFSLLPNCWNSERVSAFNMRVCVSSFVFGLGASLFDWDNNPVLFPVIFDQLFCSEESHRELLGVARDNMFVDFSTKFFHLKSAPPGRERERDDTQLTVYSSIFLSHEHWDRECILSLEISERLNITIPISLMLTIPDRSHAANRMLENKNMLPPSRIRLFLVSMALLRLPTIERSGIMWAKSPFSEERVISFIKNDMTVSSQTRTATLSMPNQCGNKRPAWATDVLKAARTGDLGRLKIIAHLGITADIKHKGRGPVQQAGTGGHNECLQQLLGMDGDINEEDTRGIQVIHSLAMTGSYSCIELLISLGVDVNTVDPCGRTPLHFSMKYGHHECSNLLLSRGAKSQQCDKWGSRPCDLLNVNSAHLIPAPPLTHLSSPRGGSDPSTAWCDSIPSFTG